MLAPSTNSAFAFIETALGERFKIEPAVGEVEIIEVAYTGFDKKIEARNKQPIAIMRFIFAPSF
jgi:hypothetical protein